MTVKQRPIHPRSNSPSSGIRCLKHASKHASSLFHPKDMPPKKSTKADAEEVSTNCLEYLQRTNRPYSATDVFNNLRQEFSKGSVTKTLAHLAEQEQIVAKTYGKQIVYVARQDQLESVSPEELAALDAGIKESVETLRVHKETASEKASALHALLVQKTDDQIRERLAVLGAEIQKSKERLDVLRAGTRTVTDQERKDTDVKYEQMRKEWRNRKRLFNDVINTLTESADFSPKSLMEELGLETDEEVKQCIATEYTAFM